VGHYTQEQQLSKLLFEIPRKELPLGDDCFGIGQGLIGFDGIDRLLKCIISRFTGLLEPNKCLCNGLHAL
jgi:hypothetical protein